MSLTSFTINYFREKFFNYTICTNDTSKGIYFLNEKGETNFRLCGFCNKAKYVYCVNPREDFKKNIDFSISEMECNFKLYQEEKIEKKTFENRLNILKNNISSFVPTVLSYEERLYFSFQCNDNPLKFPMAFDYELFEKIELVDNLHEILDDARKHLYMHSGRNIPKYLWRGTQKFFDEKV